jgi:hypothetical protein
MRLWRVIHGLEMLLEFIYRSLVMGIGRRFLFIITVSAILE